MNRMIGAGPLMPNLSQVTDIDSKGNYTRDQGSSGANTCFTCSRYKLMVDKFGVKAHNDKVSAMADLGKSLGGGNSAEND